MSMGRHNYELNAATILRDLYRLLSMVLADASIEAEVQNDDDPVVTLRERFVEDELIHLLVGTAIPNRIQMEHMRDFRAKMGSQGFQPNTYECGFLQQHVENDDEAPLVFHEACNKIIHAQHITAELDDIGEKAFQVLPPGLILRGTRGEKAWTARLSIVKYIRASVLNFSDLR